MERSKRAGKRLILNDRTKSSSWTNMPGPIQKALPVLSVMKLMPTEHIIGKVTTTKRATGCQVLQNGYRTTRPVSRQILMTIITLLKMSCSLPRKKCRQSSRNALTSITMLESLLNILRVSWMSSKLNTIRPIPLLPMRRRKS